MATAGIMGCTGGMASRKTSFAALPTIHSPPHGGAAAHDHHQHQQQQQHHQPAAAAPPTAILTQIERRRIAERFDAVLAERPIATPADLTAVVRPLLGPGITEEAIAGYLRGLNGEDNAICIPIESVFIVFARAKAEHEAERAAMAARQCRIASRDRLDRSTAERWALFSALATQDGVVMARELSAALRDGQITIDVDAIIDGVIGAPSPALAGSMSGSTIAASRDFTDQRAVDFSAFGRIFDEIERQCGSSPTRGRGSDGGLSLDEKESGDETRSELEEEDDDGAEEEEEAISGTEQEYANKVSHLLRGSARARRRQRLRAERRMQQTLRRVSTMGIIERERLEQKAREERRRKAVKITGADGLTAFQRRALRRRVVHTFTPQQMAALNITPFRPSAAALGNNDPEMKRLLAALPPAADEPTILSPPSFGAASTNHNNNSPSVAPIRAGSNREADDSTEQPDNALGSEALAPPGAGVGGGGSKREKHHGLSRKSSRWSTTTSSERPMGPAVTPPPPLSSSSLLAADRPRHSTPERGGTTPANHHHAQGSPAASTRRGRLQQQGSALTRDGVLLPDHHPQQHRDGALFPSAAELSPNAGKSLTGAADKDATALVLPTMGDDVEETPFTETRKLKQQHSTRLRSRFSGLQVVSQRESLTIANHDRGTVSILKMPPIRRSRDNGKPDFGDRLFPNGHLAWMVPLSRSGGGGGGQHV